MKKGEIYEGVIERVDFPNKGYMKIDDEWVMVKNTIPGQTLRVMINKRRRGKTEARLLAVLQPAKEERSEGVCPHFPDCGGCTYQNLSDADQRKLKEEQVLKLLHTVYEPGSFAWEGLIGSPVSAGYRNKMEFSFGDEYKDGPLALGMHKRGGFYDIVTTPHCQIVHADFGRILEATRAFFAGLSAPFYHKLKHTGYLRHLLVRRGVKTGQLLVVLVTSSKTDWMDKRFTQEEMLDEWKEQLLSLPLDAKLAGILHTQNDSLADVVKNDQTEILYGQDFFYEELLGLKFKITPFSFFQTNSLGAEVLYDVVRKYVGDTKDKVVFDLYSGTGTIAQVLADVADKVVGVEIVEEAVAAARENAVINGLANCEFIAGDVLKVVGELEDKPDVIVLDPPRDGIHPKALPKIIDFGVERIVYVSCKPTSLVRDLAVLRECGYEVMRGCGVDLFPFTANCEVVIEICRK